MKKLLFTLVALAALTAVSCGNDEETTDPTPSASILGRWDAPRFPDTPNDIAFVAIFGQENLDLYIIAWGQHLTGKYAYEDGMVNFDIAKGYQAYSDVTFDDQGNIASYNWEAGNLDAATLSLSSNYDWYEMDTQALQRCQNDFGRFKFVMNGNSATSNLTNIEDLTFNKVD